MAEPLADPCGNGFVHATNTDGSITTFDASAPGWEDKVRAIDPSHASLDRYAGVKPKRASRKAT